MVHGGAAAGTRRPPGEARSSSSTARARLRRGDGRGLPRRPPPPPPPPPPPHHDAANGRRDESGSTARAREVAVGAAAGEKGRGGAGVARREHVAPVAGAAGRNAAVAAGDGAQEAAGSALPGPREERGGGDAGRKRLSPPPPAQPKPKRRAVSARSRVPSDRWRDLATPLGRDRGADSSRFRAARGDGGSSALERAAPPTRPPHAGSKGGALRGEEAPRAAGSGVLKKKASAADGAGPEAEGSHRRPEAGVMKSSEASRRSVVPAADGLPDTGSKGAAGYTADAVRATDAGGSAASQGAMKTVVGSYYGAAQDGELEKGKDAPKVQPVQASVRHSSNGKKSENMLQSGEKGPSRIVAKDVKSMHKSGGSSGNVVAKSSAQGPSKEHLRGSFGPRKKGKLITPDHPQMKVVSASDSNKKLSDKGASNLEDDDTLKALAICEGKLELYIRNSSDRPFLRHQRQYGVQNADDRSKFKMVCRRFEFLCRALVQAVEQHSLKIDRIDIVAHRAIKKLPDFTKPGPIVGEIPGVEVGDEFLYRVQLAIVGLHRQCRGGIDTTKDRNGTPIAISIVSSGGYPDEFSCSDELIYTGSGGKRAGKKHDEDQKLKGGNLALKNCINTMTPVRVIYGFKSCNVEAVSHSRGKHISTYTYGGLYHVVELKRSGEPGLTMLMYKLKRISGQPELPLHIAERMRRSKKRPGLCSDDISKRNEGTPICVINTVDGAEPEPFEYITRIKSALRLTKARPQGCDCSNGCSDSASCACAMKNRGEFPFNSNGAIVNEYPLIFECGPSCKCPRSCHNRVSQHGMRVPLEVFRTTKTGWGVRSLRSISSGSFICEYVGELLPSMEADQRKNSDYLFDIGRSYDDENLCKGLQPRVSGLNSSSTSSQTRNDVGFTIDAAKYGNVGRFINHSCSPNLFAQNVLWDHGDKRMPHIMFFAAETIPPLQELTCEYNSKTDPGHGVNGRTKFKSCHCGSPQCRGRLY